MKEIIKANIEEAPTTRKHYLAVYRPKNTPGAAWLCGALYYDKESAVSFTSNPDEQEIKIVSIDLPI